MQDNNELENTVRLLEKEGITPEHLDDCVHDATSKMASFENNKFEAKNEENQEEKDHFNHTVAEKLASNINNQGLESQVKYLLFSCGMKPEEIISAAREEKAG